MLALKYGISLLLFLLHINLARSDCPLGEVIGTASNGTIICTPCIPDTYNNIKSNDRCYDCYHPDPSDLYVEEESPCNSTHDTKLKCKRPNFYLVPEAKTCRPCSNCEDRGQIVAKNCTETADTVCINPVYCTTKQKLVSDKGSGRLVESCKTCPLNWTNYAEQHRRDTCEDECLENLTMEGDSAVTHRYGECELGELLEGYSCSNQSIVVCRLSRGSASTSIESTTTPPPGEPEEEEDPSDDKDIPFWLWVIVVIVIALLAFVTVLFCADKIKKFTTGTYKQGKPERIPTHDEAAIDIEEESSV